MYFPDTGYWILLIGPVLCGSSQSPQHRQLPSQLSQARKLLRVYKLSLSLSYYDFSPLISTCSNYISRTWSQAISGSEPSIFNDRH